MTSLEKRLALLPYGLPGATSPLQVENPPPPPTHSHTYTHPPLAPIPYKTVRYRCGQRPPASKALTVFCHIFKKAVSVFMEMVQTPLAFSLALSLALSELLHKLETSWID